MEERSCLFGGGYGKPAANGPFAFFKEFRYISCHLVLYFVISQQFQVCAVCKKRDKVLRSTRMATALLYPEPECIVVVRAFLHIANRYDYVIYTFCRVEKLLRWLHPQYLGHEKNVSRDSNMFRRNRRSYRTIADRRSLRLGSSQGC